MSRSYNLQQCKPVATPLRSDYKFLDHENEKLMDVTSYKRLIGKLLYAIQTRPDIAFL